MPRTHYRSDPLYICAACREGVYQGVADEVAKSGYCADCYAEKREGIITDGVRESLRFNSGCTEDLVKRQREGLGKNTGG